MRQCQSGYKRARIDSVLNDLESRDPQCGSMRGSSHAEVAERTPQITIGICEDELTVAGLGWSFHVPAASALGNVKPVPALLDRQDDIDTCSNGSGEHGIDVLNAELEVHAATTRELEGSGTEPATRSDGFLNHQLDAVALEIGEALRRPLEKYPKLKHVSIETQ